MSLKIPPIEIRDMIVDYLKAHPRLKEDGEIEYPAGSGKMVLARKIARYETFPFTDWLIGPSPAIHVYFEKETRARFSPQRRKTDIQFVISCVKFTVLNNLSVDETATIAKIVQEVIEERPPLGGIQGAPSIGMVDVINYDAVPAQDRFAIMANLSMVSNYFEEFRQ